MTDTPRGRLTAKLYRWRHTVPAEPHHYVQARVEDVRSVLASLATLEATAAEGAHLGWFYYNPDTGPEWTEQHPVESGETPDAEQIAPGTLAAFRDALASAWQELAELHRSAHAAASSLAQVEAKADAYQHEADEVQQTLAKALGYPWFKDDQKNFPGATEADGVCIGEHVTATLAIEAAERMTQAEAKVAGLEAAGSEVDFYEREFYPLSNFSAFNLDFGGRVWPTSEHAYHGMKFTAKWLISSVFDAPSAHEAFKLAERFKGERRPEWDEIKVDIMRRIIRAKAEQHEYVRRKLLETGDRPLVEGSWRDDFWGIGPNRDGQNMLGKLWMELRAALASRGEGETP